MLTSLDILLEKNDKISFSPHLGSLLHGALMQQLDSEYANNMHENNLKPFSQFVHFDKENDSYTWKINTITDESKDQIINSLLTKINGKLHIEHKNSDLIIKKKIVNEAISYKDLSEEFYLNRNYNRKVVIKFLTPTSFKVDGKYVIFPYGS